MPDENISRCATFLPKIYGVKCPKCGEICFSDSNEWQIVKCKKCGLTFQAIPKD